MPESVGFTGTRSLGSDDLPTILRIVSGLPKGTRVITGGCIGVDAEIARAAKHDGLDVHTILPFDRSRVDRFWEVWCDTYEEMPAGTDYRARNTQIVQESDWIIAIADHDEEAPESRRSGTWMTVRIARRMGRPVEEHVLCSECRRPRADQEGSE